MLRTKHHDAKFLTQNRSHTWAARAASSSVLVVAEDRRVSRFKELDTGDTVSMYCERCIGHTDLISAWNLSISSRRPQVFVPKKWQDVFGWAGK